MAGYLQFDVVPVKNISLKTDKHVSAIFKPAFKPFFLLFLRNGGTDELSLLKILVSEV